MEGDFGTFEPMKKIENNHILRPRKKFCIFLELQISIEAMPPKLGQR